MQIRTLMFLTFLSQRASAILRCSLAVTGDLFVNKHSKTPVRRVLVEGDPGIGKSTFCCKLCYDWSAGKTEYDCVAYMYRYLSHICAFITSKSM